MNTNSTTTSSAALRIIISGGGTGGHIFPAISIANALKALRPDADILFVGAEGRMEMQRVPDAGYRIIGLPVAGFDRRHLWKNISVIAKLLRSQWQARRIVREFRPQAAVGVGGYASGPMLKACALAGIPTLIQEQNSYAGVTNKLLAKQAAKICVAYDGMERFFPAGKIILTGNPVRQNLLDNPVTREQAAAHFGLDPQKKTILVLGGSLGARTLNRTMEAALRDIKGHPEVQFIWQTGRIYIDEVKAAITTFTGDTSISEFCLLGKPVILVPSPNVAEDHQTKNALALVQKDAALYVKDADAPAQLVALALKTVADDQKLHSLSEHIARLALPDSADRIAKEVLKLIQQ